VVLGWAWNFSFPINKKLWTSSFVLFAGGLSLLLLALSIWMFDGGTEGETKAAKRSGWFTPLLVFGTNAISAYVFSELLASTVGSIHVRPGLNLQHWLANGILSAVPYPAFASLLYSLGFVAVCWVPTYLLFRKKIFIKI
jgi:predicted acyltransferase